MLKASSVMFVDLHAHRENTGSFKHFKVLTGQFADVVQQAEQMVKELKVDIETEHLDQEIDSLHDEIHKYHEAVSAIKDNRKWSKGTVEISSINETIARLLKTATDQAHKLAEVSKQHSLQNEEDELNDMDEFSARGEKDLDRDMQLKGPREGKRSNGKIRTAEEKLESREKKRSKRQK